MFKALFGIQNRIPAEQMPPVHAAVDVLVNGRPARAAFVQAVGRTIVTSESLGRSGEPAVLLYTTPSGRFRASTKVVALHAGRTEFALPKRTERVGGVTGAQKRASVRLDALVPGEWRFAAGGKGVGDFHRANIRDISRGGCSVIVDRSLKQGTLVEIRLHLRHEVAPLTLLGEVMRVEAIASSGRHSHGLRFHGVTPPEDQAIMDFINRKQAELRSRGLA
jgi:hypothetical protein